MWKNWTSVGPKNSHDCVIPGTCSARYIRWRCSGQDVWSTQLMLPRPSWRSTVNSESRRRWSDVSSLFCRGNRTKFTNWRTTTTNYYSISWSSWMIENNVHCVLHLYMTSRHVLSIRSLSAFDVIADYQSPWREPMDHGRDGVCQWHDVVCSGMSPIPSLSREYRSEFEYLIFWHTLGKTGVAWDKNVKTIFGLM